MARWIWIVLITACGAQPTSKTPVGNATTDPAPPPVAPAALPIAGHERIQFEVDRDRISEADAAVLDGIVRQLKADPVLKLQISGHSDAAESDPTNTGPSGLSFARAMAVRRYLVSHGIAESRLLTRAVGSAEPRGDHAANRRVDFAKVTIKVNPLGGRVVITDTDVEILDPVAFDGGSVTINPKSFPALDAVVATLQGNPTIQLVEVQSHVDERGDDAANLRLTQARAKVIRNYLIAKGVDANRLTAEGYGETQPLDRGHNAAAWAKNNRIAFLIIKRTP
jgi:outer membrane protein OmpA-like peptidoglycan-associated protein